VRDSAGVEIVESRAPTWAPADGWRVGDVPVLRIGVVEGAPEYQFDQVVGLARFPDGTLAVADGGSQEVRLFSASGAYLGTVGREGGGPGEFTLMSGMGMGPMGEAWVYDFSLRRITWLDQEGSLTGMVSLDPKPTVLYPVGPTSQGFVLRQLWDASAVAETDEPGLRRDPIAYVRFDETGALIDTVGLFPGRELVIREEDGRVAMVSPLFGKTSSSTVQGDRLVVGSQDAFEIGEYGEDGSLVRIIRVPDRDLTVTKDDVEAFVRTRLEGVPEDQQARSRAGLEVLPVRPTRPAYGEIRGDPAGNLWVAAYAQYPILPRSWSVFDPSRRWLGDVEMPPRFNPRDLGEDWLLGVETDDLGVEYVVLYSLNK